MSILEKRTTGPFRKLLLPVLSAALFMVSAAAGAEQFPLPHTSPDTPHVPEITLQSAKRTEDISLNENGDLMMRCGGILLSMACSPPDEFIDPQKRIRIDQRQNNPALIGISLKVSFMF